MGHRIDWQMLIVCGIVLWAFWFVGRQLWAQIAAFRAPRRRSQSKNLPTKTGPPPPPQLIQIQTKPPARIRRPPADE